ncbi:unnamed protein product [Porites evermanni]|uniref:Uncharacterized protein n=1 Tax=Porites evermanni TaxID=104178 RepID=A0ABN8LG29_9CNID|nr:unnamed protein product [Porites evermanni]
MTWVTLLLLGPVIACAGCRMTRFFKEENVVLRNHVIKTVTVDHPIKCQEECLDIPLCFSVNVHLHQGSSGRFTCDLNNSSKTAGPMDLVPNDGCQYRQMAEVLHCTMDQCIYKDVLPGDWFIYGSKKLKIFAENRNWTSARAYCQSIGGALVSINSEGKNEFITHLLAKLGYQPNTLLARWSLDGTDSEVNLENGATYREEDGFQSLYLNGSGAYATVPAVNFGRSSFTIACWVKLQSPASDPSPVFSDWSTPLKFLIQAHSGGKMLFGCINNFGPTLNGAWIGLNESMRVWSDGIPVSYTKWASGQPDYGGDNQKCAAMAIDGGSWKGTSCKNKLPFVCEVEI